MRKLLFLLLFLPSIVLAGPISGGPIGGGSGSPSGINTTYDANSDGIIDANKVATLNQNTTGNATTATTLAADPAGCADGSLCTDTGANGACVCGKSIGTDIPGISGTPTDEFVACFEGAATTWQVKACGARTVHTAPTTGNHICQTGATTTGGCTAAEKLAVFNIPGTSDDNTVSDSYIPAAATITGWVISTNGAACSAVVDIWVDAYANFPPTVTDQIAASAHPTLSTAQMGKGNASTWTVALAADSFMRANLDSSDCAGTITVTIFGTK